MSKQKQQDLPKSDKGFQSWHIERYQQHQQSVLGNDDRFNDFPLTVEERTILSSSKVEKTLLEIAMSDPAYPTEMTDFDVAQLGLSTLKLSLEEIEEFFENRLGRKIRLDETLVLVKEVIRRKDCVAVKFSMKQSDISYFVSSRFVREKNNEQMFVTVKMNEHTRIKLYGEIQGEVTEKFKVLFR